MKKVLVFFAVLSAMIFVMAFSASASSYEPAFGEPTILDGIAEPTILDTESRVLMTDGITYPAYYILNDSVSFSPNFSKINNIVGANKYSRATVKALEIPEGTTDLPSCWSAGGFFQGDKYEETIEYVRFPSTLQTMGEAAIFQMTTLKVIDNFENTKVEAIPTRLEGLSALQYIHLPNTVKTIPARAFFGCKSVEYIVLGSSIESIETQAFYQAGSTSGKNSLKVYASSTITAITNAYGDGILQSCNSVVELYYTGTMDDAGMQQMLASPGILKNASKWQTVDARAEDFDKNATYTSSTIIYNYSACDAFYNGQHAQDNNPCVINCSQCGIYGVPESNPVHTLTTTCSYSLGFDDYGSKITKCTNEGCKHSETESINPFFICLGYSIPVGDKAGIVVGFIIDNEAIDSYKALTNSTIEYGAFAVLETRINSNDIIDESGEALPGVIKADVTDKNISALDLKIVGFDTDENKAINIVMGMYITENGSISYLQTYDPEEGAKYSFVSYNNIVEKASTNK